VTSPSARAGSLPVAILGALLATALDALLFALALGGFGPLLHHARALALIGISGAAALALAVLRPLRGHDPIEIDRDRIALLLALFFLPLLAAPIAALGERLGLAVWVLGPAARWSGVALVALGLAMRVAAMAQLGARFSPFVAVQREHALETRGVYARLRHPGYAGAWLAALGGALAFESALGLPLVAAFFLCLRVRTVHEEVVLERRFGGQWREYRARSGRFLPRPW
jgi:protein-S-isoprenylcysteine O-methyltransferase Ste14